MLKSEGRHSSRTRLSPRFISYFSVIVNHQPTVSHCPTPNRVPFYTQNNYRPSKLFFLRTNIEEIAFETNESRRTLLCCLQLWRREASRQVSNKDILLSAFFVQYKKRTKKDRLSTNRTPSMHQESRQTLLCCLQPWSREANGWVSTKWILLGVFFEPYEKRTKKDLLEYDSYPFNVLVWNWRRRCGESET